ncbi:MAG: TadE/TadG family type IV pilus assembly protein [Sphingomicrobium sp.]|nr:pilus assembly protein [Sphingomonadales bacterium]
MIRILKQLRADQQGAAVIEMAFVAPLLAAVLVGMVDLSGAYSKKLQLEQAAQRTIEKAQQTVVDQDSGFLATLKVEAASAAGVPVTQVTVDWWLECNGVRQTLYSVVCPNGTTYARYVTVDVWDNYTPTINARFAGSNADGSFTLHGKSGLRTQ